MDAESRRITNRLAAIAAVASFITQPVPALDELIVVPIHHSLVKRLARVRGVPATELPWKPIKRIIWVGAGARLIGNFSIGLIPGVGLFSNAITAVILTEYLAQYVDQALTDPSTPPPDMSFQGLRKMLVDGVRAWSFRRASTQGA
jgi:uncharacterized protein (DUF697 family)